jgi:hypothetical protein
LAETEASQRLVVEMTEFLWLRRNLKSKWHFARAQRSQPVNLPTFQAAKATPWTMAQELRR